MFTATMLKAYMLNDNMLKASKLTAYMPMANILKVANMQNANKLMCRRLEC